MSVSLEETITKLDEVHKRGLLGIYGKHQGKAKELSNTLEYILGKM